MAEDMNTVDNRSYLDPVTAQLGERVTNLGRRQNDLEAEMRTGFSQVQNAIQTMALESRAAISSLSSSMADKNRTQWPVLISVISLSWVILGGLGFMALQPIRESLGETKSALRTTEENMVTRNDLDQRSARALEDRNRLEAAISTLRTEQVSRIELERVLDGVKLQFADQQRQIDQKRAVGVP